MGHEVDTEASWKHVPSGREREASSRERPPQPLAPEASSAGSGHLGHGEEKIGAFTPTCVSLKIVSKYTFLKFNLQIRSNLYQMGIWTVF